MQKEDLVLLITKIKKCEGSESEIDEMIQTFLKNVPDPNALDYIFGIEYESLSAHEIVNKSLDYKSIQL